MKIIIHAGLHKSGTTYVQNTWRNWFHEDNFTYYPDFSNLNSGHELIAWHNSQAYHLTKVPYLAFYKSRNLPTQSLSSLIQFSQYNNYQTLLISAEEFDNYTKSDLESLNKELAGCDVTLIITITPPTHRYFSGWQELVKHAFKKNYFFGFNNIIRFSKLKKSQLNKFISKFPATTKEIYLVDPSQIDPHLPAKLLHNCTDIKFTEKELITEFYNRNIGGSIGILHFLNKKGYTAGILNEYSNSLFSKQISENSITAKKSKISLNIIVSILKIKSVKEKNNLKKLESDGTVVIRDPNNILKHWDQLWVPAWLDNMLKVKSKITSKRIYRFKSWRSTCESAFVNSNQINQRDF